LME
jgi:hypothetical protein